MEKFKIIQIGANVGNTDNDPLFSKLMEGKSASINFNSVFKNTKDGRLGEEIWTTFTKNK